MYTGMYKYGNNVHLSATLSAPKVSIHMYIRFVPSSFPSVLSFVYTHARICVFSVDSLDVMILAEITSTRRNAAVAARARARRRRRRWRLCALWQALIR